MFANKLLLRLFPFISWLPINAAIFRGDLMAGVIEHHDKSRFETIGISLGVDDNSRIRARMMKAFDRFVDARAMSSAIFASRRGRRVG